MKHVRFLLKGLACGCVFVALLVAGQTLSVRLDRAAVAMEVSR